MAVCKIKARSVADAIETKQSASLAVSEPFQEVRVDTRPLQVVEDLTDRLDDEGRSYVEIGASDDEEERKKIKSSWKHFIWDEAIMAMLKVAWEKLCADRYADFTYRMRRSGKKQQCVSQEIWESWQKAWEDPAFKRKREIFAQNRCNETGGDGAGPSRHTGGSISAIETT
ncbi:hypothetical protein JCGZ_03526 [Jatropha curcas]|uniref:Uncharacterized protein n=1 Tax=Jatropha curcas TaxID=180498 RepID=A0A067JDH4_JATCU|nr:hypothetical protein JCGZ_03526 [Jatropha curcas]